MLPWRRAPGGAPLTTTETAQQQQKHPQRCKRTNLMARQNRSLNVWFLCNGRRGKRGFSERIDLDLQCLGRYLLSALGGAELLLAAASCHFSL